MNSVKDNDKKLTKAELVLFIGFITSILLFFLMKGRYKFIAPLYVLILFSIASYNIHCIIHGKCIIFSNILTTIYVIYPTILIGYLIIKRFS